MDRVFGVSLGFPDLELEDCELLPELDRAGFDELEALVLDAELEFWGFC